MMNVFQSLESVMMNRQGQLSSPQLLQLPQGEVDDPAQQTEDLGPGTAFRLGLGHC